MERRLRLFDDSGLLSIVDLRRYSPFVGDDWTYEQLLRKFQRAMAEGAADAVRQGRSGRAARLAPPLQVRLA